MFKCNLSKKVCLLVATALIGTTVLGGCGKSASTAASGGSGNDKVTLTVLEWNNALDPQGMASIAEEYKKVKPNVTIQIETVKDTGEFEQTMKIRKTANQLPDVFPLKPYLLSTFSDFLEDMSDVPAAQNNLYADKFKVNGKMVGIPAEVFNEFVWYKKSIFKEYGLSVPKTWDEFIQAAQKIKQGGKYIPILMGGKDAWPDYPFNEYMPSLIANDGALWNKMATDDQPFSPDKPFYKAYEKIDQLYKAKVFGADPLGMGYDQAKMMFGTQGAMLCAGQWALPDIKKALNNDTSDVGTFFLPVRDKASDKLNTITTVDLFLATPKAGKHAKEAKDFINWYLSNESLYKSFTKFGNVNSTMKNIKADIDPAIQEAYDNDKDVNQVLYDGGNADFQKIQSATKLDVKKIGQDMMAGKDFKKILEDLNVAWKSARGK